MNIQIGNIENGFEVKLATKNDFHVARSVFLDAFSELEIAVCRLLGTTIDIKPGEKKPFGPRVEELKNIKPDSRFPKEKCAKIHDKAAKILPILLIRSDMVHSQLQFVDINGVMHAIICNNNSVINDPTLVRLLNIDCFKLLTREAKSIANELRQILNPPASPRPPSQGAAAGL